MHALDLIKSAATGDRPVIVLHGDEASLKSSALAALATAVLGAGSDASDLGRVRLRGADCDWPRVRDELSSISMFGERRLIIVEEADGFVTDYRTALEAYCDRPARRSVLVLDVQSWRKNTRLAKKLDDIGMEIECAELTGSRLTGWLVELASTRFGKQLSRDAAALMVELAGSGLGQLEQELGKLASYVGEAPRVGLDDVRRLVGGWRAETTWTMLDAVRDGDTAEALACLHKLMFAGEAAAKLLGGVNFVFRKFGAATEASRQGRPLSAALKEAGVFFRDIDKAEAYLRRIRRPRAEAILARLVKADSDLKGGSPLSDRLQMEQLLMWLSGTSA